MGERIKSLDILLVPKFLRDLWHLFVEFVFIQTFNHGLKIARKLVSIAVT
jgi:hypothetical protein